MKEKGSALSHTIAGRSIGSARLAHSGVGPFGGLALATDIRLRNTPRRLAGMMAVVVVGVLLTALAVTGTASARGSSAQYCGVALPARLVAAHTGRQVIHLGPVRNSFGSSMLGVAAGGGLQDERASALAQDLAADSFAGARWLRLNLNWIEIQRRGPSSYDWTHTDAAVSQAERCGMKVLGVIVSTPAWARPRGTTAAYAPDPRAYASFAATVVRHYAARGVHVYEVWNEPNLVASWQPKPNPGAYVRLLKAAYPAIKAADPSATVLSGGLAPGATNGRDYSPVDFFARVYAHGAKGYFDAVGINPYCWPAYPGDAVWWSPWYQMYGTHPSVRSLMVSHGDGAKLIWGLEFGAPTNGPRGHHVSETVQARMLMKAYQLWASYRWTGPLFYYQGRDLGTDRRSLYDFYGFLNHDFSPKPAYTAFQAIALALRALGRS